MPLGRSDRKYRLLVRRTDRKRYPARRFEIVPKAHVLFAFSLARSLFRFPGGNLGVDLRSSCLDVARSLFGASRPGKVQRTPPITTRLAKIVRRCSSRNAQCRFVSPCFAKRRL